MSAVSPAGRDSLRTGGAPVAMPRSRTAPALLAELAERHPDTEFVVGGGRRLTYPEFRAEARRFARGLHALGVRRGDKVAILMGNRPEWLIADFAILALGAVMVSLNTWATRRELAWMLDHSETTVLVTVDRFLGQDYTGALREAVAAGSLPRLRHVVRIAPDRRELPGGMSWRSVMEIGEAVPERDLDAAEAAVEPPDVACISTPPAPRRPRRAFSSSTLPSSRTCGTSANGCTFAPGTASGSRSPSSGASVARTPCSRS